MLGSHSYVEPIVIFSCACTYSFWTLESQFVYQFVSESHQFTNNESFLYCNEDQNATISTSEQEQIVADEVSSWTKVGNMLRAVMNCLSVLVITSWSDVIGRRNALLFPVVGALICSSLLLLNLYTRLSLYIYIASSFVYGATGGWTTLINVGTAHLSDTVEKSTRGYRYTLLEMCAAIAGGSAQVGTGYWLHRYGFIPPAILVVSCATVALLFTVFLRTTQGGKDGLETWEGKSSESDKLTSNDLKDHVNSTSGVKAILSQLKKVFRIYTSNSVECGECDLAGITCSHCNGSKNRVSRLWLFLITYVIYMSAVDGFELFITMFLLSSPLCFTPNLVGIQRGMDSSVMILSPVVMWLFRSQLQFSVQSTLLAAVLGRIITSILMFEAETPALVFIATAFGAVSNLTTPFIRVQISNLVSPTEQGPALALIPSMAKGIEVLSPMIILTIYTSTLYIRHSFIWAVLAIYFMVAFLLMSVVWVADKIHGQKQQCNKRTT